MFSFSNDSFPSLGCRRTALAILLLATLAFCSSAFCDPIHNAARKGDLVKVKELVKQNPSLISTKDKMGNTPLHMAAANDHKDVAEFLLENGADVNARDSNGGFTPLDAALSSYHYKNMVVLLLEKGANVNAKADNGLTPLHEVAMRGQKDAAEMLLSKNPDVDARDNQGNTPLLWALLMGRSDVAELLVTKNADVNARNNQGTTPLFLAKQRGNAKLEDLLRQRGGHE